LQPHNAYRVRVNLGVKVRVRVASQVLPRLPRQTCNPLGAAKNIHKMCGSQMAFLNLPAEERFTKENIMLTVLTAASVYKKHGMLRVLCGVDEDGKQHEEPNWAADLRALDTGIWIKIPDGAGGQRDVRIRAWVIGVN
jgi:hypothetical protein